MQDGFGDADLAHVVEQAGHVDALDFMVGQSRFLGEMQPREALTLYRGALPGYARGMAWTTSQKRAAWFADTWAQAAGRKAFVYTVDAPPDAILATLPDRKDSEVVVDPRRISKPARAERAIAS